MSNAISLRKMPSSFAFAFLPFQAPRRMEGREDGVSIIIIINPSSDRENGIRKTHTLYYLTPRAGFTCIHIPRLYITYTLYLYKNIKI
jgi:hypothetical protein